MKAAALLALPLLACAHVEPAPKVVMMRCKIMPRPEKPVIHFAKEGDRVVFPASEAPALAAYHRGMDLWSEDVIARCGEETAQ
jgi:hypothetical protein